MTWAIDIRKATFLDDIAQTAVDRAAENVGTMTGEDTRAVVRQTNTIDLRDIADEVGMDQRVAIRVELEEPPYGYVVLLLPRASAKRIVRLMIQDMVPDLTDASQEMITSAIEEVGHMTVSGFIAGIADTLDRSIDTTPPELLSSKGGKVAAKTAARRGENPALMLATTVVIPSERIRADIYAFPGVREFVHILNDTVPAGGATPAD